MARKNPADSLALDHTCRLVSLAFDAPVFLVGSCLHTVDCNDVDLRCPLEDSEAVFANELRHWFINGLVSEWLAIRTGLNCDFQFKPRSKFDPIDARQIGVPITSGADFRPLNLPKGEKL
jgi:hypothetical protein